MVLHEDIFIRDYFLKNFPKDIFNDLEIERRSKFLTITVYVVNSESNLLLNDEVLFSLRSKLSNLLAVKFTSRVITLKVSVIEKADCNPRVLCKFISQQLQRRVPFRRVMRAAILKARKYDIKGVKIQISGRLNGAEIARTEWIREGKIPLQNLMANLDYCSFNSLVHLFYFNYNLL